MSFGFHSRYINMLTWFFWIQTLWQSCQIQSQPLLYFCGVYRQICIHCKSFFWYIFLTYGSFSFWKVYGVFFAGKPKIFIKNAFKPRSARKSKPVKNHLTTKNVHLVMSMVCFGEKTFFLCVTGFSEKEINGFKRNPR